MEKVIDDFIYYCWLVTDKEIYQLSNEKIIKLLNCYCNKVHWMRVEERD